VSLSASPAPSSADALQVRTRCKKHIGGGGGLDGVGKHGGRSADIQSAVFSDAAKALPGRRFHRPRVTEFLWTDLPDCEQALAALEPIWLRKWQIAIASLSGRAGASRPLRPRVVMAVVIAVVVAVVTAGRWSR
jgi:hypothetical protein